MPRSRYLLLSVPNTMEGHCLFVGLLAIVAASVGLELEAESGSHSGTKMHRSAASNGATVWLLEGGYIDLPFTVPSPRAVSVQNVAYTNDGASDSIRISIDGSIVGSFQTLGASDSGYNWNVVQGSGSIGLPVSIKSGSHLVQVEAVGTDDYGVEIDKVMLTFQGEDTASMECIDPPSSFASSRTWTCNCSEQAWVVQRSTETGCAEEDNIHIPIYFGSLDKFTITATLPRYSNLTDRNDREANFTNCKLLSPTIWTFGSADSSSDEFSPSCNTPQAPYSVYETPTNFCRELNAENLTEAMLTFVPKGQSSGLVEANIGSVLTVQFAQVSGTIEIEASSYGDGWVSLGTGTFTPTTMIYSWSIPDFTWREGATNMVKFRVVGSSSSIAKALFDFVKLEMRQEMGEYEIGEIYNDGVTIIKAIGKDFWWLHPQSMVVTNTRTGQQWYNVIYIRVSRKIPDIDSWPEVFVLYQDGNSRILTFPPSGIDWIPFGSSVIVGQSNPDSVRPYAAISEINVDPKYLQMTLHYASGGKAILSIITGSLSTTVTVSNITYNTVASLPFATLRSMWVSDTNADVDHVSTESGDWHIVEDDWSELLGTKFVFHRICVSGHNTLSPDIAIEVSCSDRLNSTEVTESTIPGTSGTTSVSTTENVQTTPTISDTEIPASPSSSATMTMSLLITLASSFVVGLVMQ